MICYRDMTFCSAECVNTKCPRLLTPKVFEEAAKWWDHDPENAPIATSDFSGDCPAFIPHPEMFRG